MHAFKLPVVTSSHVTKMAVMQCDRP